MALPPSVARLCGFGLLRSLRHLAVMVDCRVDLFLKKKLFIVFQSTVTATRKVYATTSGSQLRPDGAIQSPHRWLL